MDIQDRNTLDKVYRDLVNKREEIIHILESLDQELFNFERVLYDLHEDGWNPGDLFYEE